MLISDLTKTREAGLVTVGATVAWEESEQAPQSLHFATRPEYGDDLEPNPNAFLLATAITAMQYGERRLRVEGALCPQLRNGLQTAMQILRVWYGDAASCEMAIEATAGFVPASRPEQRGAVSFMSGGVDSLTTLRCNRRDFPADHPGSIRDCLFVHGFDVGGYASLDKNFDHFDLAVARISELTESVGANLIPVFTNLRHLERADPLVYEPQLTEFGMHGQLFTMASHGAALAAVAHAFGGRFARALIPSSKNIAELVPLGSHPMLDPNYGSSEIWIQHDGASLGRLDKIRLVAEWPDALRALRTCSYTLRPSDSLNCGKCEKCLRTMTELLVVGRLGECPSFPLDDISVEDLDAISVTHVNGAPPGPFIYDVNEHYWSDLLTPLRSIGRTDLADLMASKLDKYRSQRRSRRRRDAVKALDRRFLGGLLARLASAIPSGAGL